MTDRMEVVFVIARPYLKAAMARARSRGSSSQFGLMRGGEDIEVELMVMFPRLKLARRAIRMPGLLPPTRVLVCPTPRLESAKERTDRDTQLQASQREKQSGRLRLLMRSD